MEIGWDSLKSNESEEQYTTPANYRRTHREYWNVHKEEINEARRKRYREDSEYRQRILEDNAQRASQDREGVRAKNRSYREANKDKINAKRKLKRKLRKVPEIEYPFSEVVLENFSDGSEVSGLVLFLDKETFDARDVEDSIRVHFEAYFREFFPQESPYLGEALRVTSRDNLFGVRYSLPEDSPLRGMEGRILKGYYKLFQLRK
jgi:hypothetical protein